MSPAMNALRSLVCLSLLACNAPTVSLYVDLRTDLVPGVEFSRVEVGLEGPDVVREAPAQRGDDFFLGRRVAELVGLAPSEERRLTVRLLGGDHREVVRRTVQVQHREDRSVTVLITRSCRGVTCPAGESCVAGACAPEGCEEDRGSCTDECASATDCAPSSCGQPSCEARACLYSQREGACAAGLYCDYERGCLPEPGTLLDAGTPDGGTDAGPSPAFGLWSLPRGASAWSSVETSGTAAPSARVVAAFAPPGFPEIVALTDTGVHALRLSDLRWIEQLDRDAVFPELAGVDVWAAARVPGTPGGLFVYARAGAWEYEWDAAARSATFTLYTARADFGSDWSDPRATPYPPHAVYGDPDNADGWITVDPSAECSGRTQVGRNAVFVGSSGFGPSSPQVSVYDIDCLRFVDQLSQTSFPPFALPGAPYFIDALARADDGLFAFTMP